MSLYILQLWYTICKLESTTITFFKINIMLDDGKTIILNQQVKQKNKSIQAKFDTGQGRH